MTRGHGDEDACRVNATGTMSTWHSYQEGDRPTDESSRWRWAKTPYDDTPSRPAVVGGALMDQDMVKRLRASNEYDLTAARLLDCAAVCVEKGWTQNTDARDERGNDIRTRATLTRCAGAPRAPWTRLRPASA